MRHGIILAGGVGSRLWPISRESLPKQFQKLAGAKTLIQETFDRLAGVVDSNNIWVVTNAAFRHLALTQLPTVATNQILCEPVARNTAPAIGLALFSILRHDPKADIVSTHADHFVGQPKVFTRSIKAGLNYISDQPNYLVTVGVKPTSPDTGLGYIKITDQIAEVAGPP
ncbi:MAG: sugar phosphate nucleotidyltransferase, partial [Patescibacteria group bacterium]